jgi:hypothetical protein
MPAPTEHKTVQARILSYAQEIGWTFVPREEAERWRGFDPGVPAKERAKGGSLFFEGLLASKVRESNPRYREGGDELIYEIRGTAAVTATILATKCRDPGSPPLPWRFSRQISRQSVHWAHAPREKEERRQGDSLRNVEMGASYVGWIDW